MIGKAEVLKSTDVKNVLKMIATNENPQRNRIIFLLSYLVGMRVHNIQKIVFGDVYDDNGKVYDKIVLNADKNKGKKVAEYYLNEKIKKELAEYYKWCKSVRLHIDGNDYLLWSQKTMKALHKGSIVRIFRRIYDSVGLYKCRSHSGRRSFASNLLNKSVSIQVVSRLMNHQSISCTMTYYQQNPTLLNQAVNILEV